MPSPYPDPRTTEGKCPDCGLPIKFWWVRNSPMNSHKTVGGKLSCEIQQKLLEKRDGKGGKAVLRIVIFTDDSNVEWGEFVQNEEQTDWSETSDASEVSVMLVAALNRLGQVIRADPFYESSSTSAIKEVPLDNA